MINRVRFDKASADYQKLGKKKKPSAPRVASCLIITKNCRVLTSKLSFEKGTNETRFIDVSIIQIATD